ncbi:MAG: 4Fe-4S binding protein [bacterium]|nr:4Fe-4S binding protein [bacterium]
MRRRWPQLLRRSLQLGVIALVIYAALGGPWRNYKLAHNHRRLVSLIEGPVWGTLYGLNEDALSLLSYVSLRENPGDPARASLGFLGFPWSARVFGIETADPSMVLATTISTRTFDPELWLGLALPVLLALLLGKVFCSHLCPMRLLFELGQGVRRGLERFGFELPELRSRHRWGGWVLAGGLLATLASSTAIWLVLLPYASFGASLFLLVTAGTLSGLAVVVAAWWLLDLLVAPGFFCHNLCPTGFLLETVSRFSLFRVRKVKAECPPSCDLCHRTCPYGLEPALERHHPACDNCGRCVAVCPGERLVRRIGRAAVAGMAVLALAAAPAHAHHNKGLPHYGYYENYPQVPTEEYIDFVGRWEIGAVIFNFQGMDRRAADTPNDVKIFLYLYDLEADQGYDGPLAVEIRRKGEVVSRFDRLQVDEEAVYSTRETLPASGDYELVAFVERPAEGGQEKYVEGVPLRFHADLSTDRIRWGLIVGLGAPVAVVFWLALFGRRRGRRRRRRSATTPAPEGMTS